MKTKLNLENMRNAPALALGIAMAILIGLPLASAAIVAPPAPLSVEGHIFYSDGSPVDRGVPVLVENLGNGQVELTATGRGFPPVEQYKNSYKASLAFDPAANQSIRVSAVSLGRHSEVTFAITSNDMMADLTLTSVPTDVTRLLIVGLVILGAAVYITRKKVIGGQGRRKGVAAVALLVFLVSAGLPALAENGQQGPSLLDTLVTFLTDIFRAVTALATGGEEGGAGVAGPPSVVDVKGFVFNSSFAGGVLAANATLVNVTVYFPNGTMRGQEQTYTGKGYPPVSQYYPQYTASVSGELGVDTINVTATNGTHWGYNSSIAASTIKLNISMTQLPPDTTPPRFSNNVSSIVTFYSETNTSWFNTTWNDNVAVTTVVFELNISGSPVNYSATTDGNVYFLDTIVPAGTYYWISYANDSSGNTNATLRMIFTVAQADNPTHLFFRNSTGEYVDQDMTITYPAQSNATATAMAGATLSRDGIYTGGATEVKALGAGVWAYKANATGNQNYTANFTGVTYYLYVNQASNPVSLTLNGQQNDITVPYGTPITPVASGPDGVNVYKDDTTATSGQSLNLAVGTYAFKVNSTGNTNYTVNATGLTFSANVTPVTPTVSIGFVPSNPVTYGTQTTATCTITTGDPSANLILLRNGTQVGTGAGSASETNTLGGGLYNYTCIYQPSENYTAGSSTDNYLIVTPAAAGLLTGTMHALINGAEADASYQYENTTNVTGYSTMTGQGGLIFNLYRNAVSADSSSSEPYAVSDVKQLGALTYTYIYNTTGNQNYSAASVTRTLTINKKTPTLSLSTAGTVNYTMGAGASGSATVLPQSDFTISLQVSGIGQTATDSTYPYSVADNNYYGGGSYTFTLSNGASTNYTAASTTANLTVNPITPSLALAVMPSNSVTYPTTTTATGTVVFGDSGTTTQLWRNGTNVGTSTETILLDTGSYNYTFVYLGSQNFTASSISNATIVQQNTTNPIDITINNGTAYTNKNVTISYGTSVTVSGSTVYQNSGTVQLHRDGQNVTNPATITLGGGEHAFKADTTGNNNYAANSTGATYYVIVGKVASAVSVGFVPSNSETYGTQTTATCTITVGDPSANLILLRNGTQVGTGAGSANETNTLAAGVYNYTCIYQPSENYTVGYSYNNYLTITPAAAGVLSGTMHVLLNGAESNQAFDYETITNVTGYSTITGQSGLTFNLYKNALSTGSSGSEPYAVSDVKQLGALTYTYIYNTTGNQNYSAASVTRTLTINKKTPTLSLSTAGTISYGSGSGVSGSATVLPQTDFTINLYVNSKGPIGTDPTYPYAVSDNTVYGGGGYTFTLNNSASANYTAGSTTAGLTVNPIASSVTVTLSPSNSVSYGTQTTATCSITTGDSGATLALLRNGTQVNSSTGSVSETNTLAGGAYNYACDYQASQNYTAGSSTNNYLTVTPLGAGVLQGTMLVLLNGAEADQAFDYETATNVTGYSTITGQVLTFNLYRNAVSAGSSGSAPYIVSDVSQLGANIYTYIYNTTGNQNYSAASVTRTLTINKKAPTLALSTAGTISYGAGSGVSGNATVLSQADYTIHLYVNGQGPISTDSAYPYAVSDNTVYGAGNYTFTLNNSASANYLQASTTTGLTVNAATPSITVTLSPSNSVSYGTQTTATCSITIGDPGATLALLRNGTQVNSSTGSVSETDKLGAAVYNYTCIYQAGGNYTNGYSYDNYLTVAHAAGSCSLNINPATPITYGTATNASCSCTGTPNLYRNHSSANAENNVNIVLPVGFWNYTCNSTASGNATGANISQGYQVNKAGMPLTLLLNGTDDNKDYMKAEFANFTITTTVTGLAVQLFTNYSDGVNKLWDSGTSPFTNLTMLNVTGVFNFTGVFAGNQNYTAANVTHIANVTAVPPFSPSNLVAILNKTATGDILLNWSSNVSNIANFVVYKTDNYSAGFNFATVFGTTPADQYNFTDNTANSTNERYYIVRANSTDGLQDSNTHAVGKFGLKLYTDWTLVSLETLLIHNESLDDITYDAQAGDQIWRYDANDTLDPYKKADYFAGFGWIGDFVQAQPDRGYWYLSNKPGFTSTSFDIATTGAVAQANRSMLLFNDFNLVGLVSVANHGLTGMFPSASDLDEAWRYDSTDTMDPFKRSRFFAGYGWYGDFQLFNPGRGYWYKAGATGNFTNDYDPTP